MKGLLSSAITIATILVQLTQATHHLSRTAAHYSAVSSDATSNPNYYLVWWFAPSGSVVTGFDSIMEIPNLSSNTGVGPRYVWPGLENAATNFVFQNVIGDQQPAGEWTFATWYVGEGQDYEYNRFEVLPGDLVESTFTLDSASANSWTDDWFRESNDVNTNGGVEVAFATEGSLTNALFAIELWDGAEWDFGSVTFTDIRISVNSASTSWCTSPSIGSFQYTMTTPQATVIGDTCTCTISKLVFVSP